MSIDGPAEKPPTTSLVAGKYELIRMIGRGGMGSVWEARHVSLGTKVAIKFVEVEQAKSEEARARFQNEARAAATIQSKHAIKVYDHGLLEDGRPYIVMELLVGEPLDKRLDLVGRLPLTETARMVQQVARALQQAHDSGITHRDLKPENIFIEHSQDDDVEMAKVLDFGIAKIKGPVQALAVSSSTKTGVLMGTPFFMSPEQARGLKTVDYRSDLWSLGVIVYRCVTGELPFNGESLGDLLVKICAAPIPIPSDVVPELSPNFNAWMLKALDRDPALRFQSALDLADSLAGLAGISVASRRTPDLALAYQGTEALPAVSSRPGGQPSARPGSSPGTNTPAPDPHALTAPPDGVTGPNLDLYRQPPTGVTSPPFTASAASPPKTSWTGALVVGGLVIALAGAAGIMAAIMRGSATPAVVAAPALSVTPTPTAPEAPASVATVVPSAATSIPASSPTNVPDLPSVPQAAVTAAVSHAGDRLPNGGSPAVAVVPAPAVKGKPPIQLPQVGPKPSPRPGAPILTPIPRPAQTAPAPGDPGF